MSLNARPTVSRLKLNSWVLSLNLGDLGVLRQIRLRLKDAEEPFNFGLEPLQVDRFKNEGVGPRL
jgi:hypothetical protein